MSPALRYIIESKLISLINIQGKQTIISYNTTICHCKGISSSVNKSHVGRIMRNVSFSASVLHAPVVEPSQTGEELILFLIISFSRDVWPILMKAFMLLLAQC